MHAARHVIARPFVLYPNDKKEDAKRPHLPPAISPCKLYFLQEFSGYVTWFSGEVVPCVGFRRGFPMTPRQSIRFAGRNWGTTRPVAVHANPKCELLRYNSSLALQVSLPWYARGHELQH